MAMLISFIQMATIFISFWQARCNCDTNCVQEMCKNDNGFIFCDQCQPGYVLNNSDFTCQPVTAFECGYNYSNETNCSLCSGYMNMTGFLCHQCANNTVLTENNHSCSLIQCRDYYEGCEQCEGTIYSSGINSLNCTQCSGNYSIELNQTTNKHQCKIKCDTLNPNCMKCMYNSQYSNFSCMMCNNQQVNTDDQSFCVSPTANQCYSLKEGCETCQGSLNMLDLECLTCNSSFYKNEINECAPNCSLIHAQCSNCKYDNTLICKMCINGYIVSNLNCIQSNSTQCNSYIAGCQSCDGNPPSDVFCRICGNGTIVTTDLRKCIQSTPSQCSSLILHCTVCQGSIKNLDMLNCTLCEQGYALQNNQCQMNCRNISTYCSQCQDSLIGPVCLLCEQYKIVGNDQRSCVTPTSLQCSNIISDCILCQGSTSSVNNLTCISCASGYGLVNNTCQLQCIVADQDCTQCTGSWPNSFQCTNCQKGKLPSQDARSCQSSSSQQCYQLITNCEVCSGSLSSPQCEVCNTGFCLYVNDTSRRTCTQNSQNSAILLQCTICAINETGLSIPNQCLACSSGYVKSIYENCTDSTTNPDLYCGSIAYCKACQGSIDNINNSSLKCTSCASPLYIVSNDMLRCICSITNCIDCFIDDTDGNKTKCRNCQNGMVPSDNQFTCISNQTLCESIIPNCVTCQGNSSQLTCLVCGNQTFPNLTGQECVPCFQAIEKCEECQVSLTGQVRCLQCGQQTLPNITTNGSNCVNQIEICQQKISECVLCQGTLNQPNCSACLNNKVPSEDQLSCICNITDCVDCYESNNITLCKNCRNSKIPSADFTQCVPSTQIQCSYNVPSCQSCQGSLQSLQCLQCSAPQVPSSNMRRCVCSDFANCELCDPDRTACLRCSDGYTLNSENTCIVKDCSSIPGCGACELIQSLLTCLYCLSGAPVNVSAQQPCQISSLTCSIENCKICGGYGPEKTCESCNNGFTLSYDKLRCINSCQALLYCISCTNGQCQTCEHSSFIINNSTKICECPTSAPNIVIYQGVHQCLNIANYISQNSTQACNQLIPLCHNCTLITIDNSLINPLLAKDQEIVCSNCSNNQVNILQNSGRACIDKRCLVPNCANCTTSGTCQACQQGYTVATVIDSVTGELIQNCYKVTDTSSCDAIPNCRNCFVKDNQLYCSQCIGEFIPSSDLTFCRVAVQSATNQFQQMCAQQIENCQDCEVDTAKQSLRCVKCSENYQIIIYGNSYFCFPANVGLAKTTLCSGIIPNCLTCQTVTFSNGVTKTLNCSQCKSFYKQVSQVVSDSYSAIQLQITVKTCQVEQCQDIIEGCQTCKQQNGTICTQCIFGFTLSSTQRKCLSMTESLLTIASSSSSVIISTSCNIIGCDQCLIPNSGTVNATSSQWQCIDCSPGFSMQKSSYQQEIYCQNTNCPVHFYLIQDTKECAQCEPQCRSCEDQPSICVQCAQGRIDKPPLCPCQDGYLEVKGECRSQCNAQQLWIVVQNKGQCKYCFDAPIRLDKCKVCEQTPITYTYVVNQTIPVSAGGIYVCRICETGYVLVADACQTTSNADMQSKQQYCDNYATNLFDQTKVYTPHTFIYFGIEKMIYSTNGTIIDKKQGFCTPCPTPCQSCRFNLQLQPVAGIECISCPSGLSLINGICKNLNCQETQSKYYDQNTAACLDCPVGCQQCRFLKEIQMVVCDVCQDGFYKLVNTCIKICTQEGYYPTPIGICSQCPTGCKSCFMLLNNNNQKQIQNSVVCLQCKIDLNYYFDLFSKQCSKSVMQSASCLSKEYKYVDVVGKQHCFTCLGCTKCALLNQESALDYYACSACDKTYQYLDTFSQRCVVLTDALSCQIGEYLEITSVKSSCKKCGVSLCQKCFERDYCSVCSPGQYLSEDAKHCLNQPTCSLSNQVMIQELKTCYNCSEYLPGCQQCIGQQAASGRLQINCIKCFTQYNLILQDGLCIFTNQSVSCQNLTDLSNNSNNSNGSYFFKVNLLTKRYSKLLGSSGTTTTTTVNEYLTCAKCPPGCINCRQVTQNPFIPVSCESCSTGYSIKKLDLFKFVINMCVINCIGRTFFNFNDDRCQPCSDPNCLQCAFDSSNVIITSQNDICLQCINSQYVLKQSKCVLKTIVGLAAIVSQNSCPTNSFFNDEIGICECVAGMSISFSSTTTSTLQCVNKENIPCQTGMYDNSGECRNCMVQIDNGRIVEGICIHCVSARQCLECAPGYFLLPKSNMCKKCSSYCLRCVSSRDCVKCENGKFLSDGVCSEKCLDGMLILIESFYRMNQEDLFKQQDPSYIYGNQAMFSIPDSIAASNKIARNCFPIATTLGKQIVCRTQKDLLPFQLSLTGTPEYEGRPISLQCVPCQSNCDSCTAGLYLNVVDRTCVDSCDFPLRIQLSANGQKVCTMLSADANGVQINMLSRMMTTSSSGGGNGGAGLYVQNSNKDLVLEARINGISPQPVGNSSALFTFQWRLIALYSGEQVQANGFSQQQSQSSGGGSSSSSSTEADSGIGGESTLDPGLQSEVLVKFVNNVNLNGPSQLIVPYTNLMSRIIYKVEVSALLNGTFQAQTNSSDTPQYVYRDSIQFITIPYQEELSFADIGVSRQNWGISLKQGLAVVDTFCVYYSFQSSKVILDNGNWVFSVEVTPAVSNTQSFTNTWNIYFQSKKLADQHCFSLPNILVSQQVAVAKFQAYCAAAFAVTPLIIKGQTIFNVYKPKTFQITDQASFISMQKLINGSDPDAHKNITLDKAVSLAGSLINSFQEMEAQSVSTTSSTSTTITGVNQAKSFYSNICNLGESATCSNSMGKCVAVKPGVNRCQCLAEYQGHKNCKYQTSNMTEFLDNGFTIAKAVQMKLEILKSNGGMNSQTAKQGIETAKLILNLQGYNSSIIQSIENILNQSASLINEPTGLKTLMNVVDNLLDIYEVSEDSLFNSTLSANGTVQRETVAAEQQLIKKSQKQQLLRNLTRAATINQQEHLNGAMQESQTCSTYICSKLQLINVESAAANASREHIIGITSNDGSLDQRVVIPATMLQNFSSICAILIRNPKKMLSGMTNQTMTTDSLDIQLYQNCKNGRERKQIQITDSSMPIKVAVNFDLSVQESKKQCVWIDEGAGVYRSDGCKYNAVLKQCECTHLTEFFGIEGNPILPTLPTNLSQSTNTTSNNTNNNSTTNSSSANNTNTTNQNSTQNNNSSSNNQQINNQPSSTISSQKGGRLQLLINLFILCIFLLLLFFFDQDQRLNVPVLMQRRWQHDRVPG